MPKDVRMQQSRVSRPRQKGSLEVHTLVIWVILLVFLALMLLILVIVQGKSEGILGGLCLGPGC
jgi:hypothetical protein